MFAYCNNNPVIYADKDGFEPEEAIDIDGDGVVDYYVYSYTYSSGILFWEKEYTGNVYIYVGKTQDFFDSPSNQPEGFNSITDVMVGDYTSSSNPNMYAYRADRVQEKHRVSILNCLLEYDSDFNTPWERTLDSLQTEWVGHALFAWASHRAKNIDFDNKEEGEPLSYFFKKAAKAGIDSMIATLN